MRGLTAGLALLRAIALGAALIAFPAQPLALVPDAPPHHHLHVHRTTAPPDA